MKRRERLNHKYHNPNGPIVHVIGEFASAGAESVMRDLAIELVAQGREVEVWRFYRAAEIHPGDQKAACAEEIFTSELEAGGVTVRAIDKRVNKDYSRTWKRIRVFARQAKPAVVHTHLEEISFHTCAALVGTRIPIVQTMHSDRIRRVALLRHFFRYRCRRFVCISEAIKKQTSRYVPERKLVLIANGIPLKAFTVADRDYSGEVRSLVAAGRLTEAKNHHMMLEAFGRIVKWCLRDGREPPILTIWGEGELRADLEEFVDQRGLRDFVRLPGTTDRMARELRDADIYLMSSDYEGMSISLLEAMPSALPIVTTAVSGAKDLLRDGESACVSDIGDADAFANHVRKLMSEPDLRARLGQAATVTASKFSIVVCAERHRALYDSLHNGISF